MAKHAKSGAGKTAVKVAKGTGRGVAVVAIGTAKGIRGTARATATTLNFCISPFCLHDSRTANCKRKCCQ